MKSLLRMEQIDKRFPGVHALKAVSLEILAGEIHALIGENGAGKSTLIKILCGALAKDGGTIFWEDEAVQINSPSRAAELGIAVIYQELTLVPHLDVGQNIYLGREPAGKLPGTVAWTQLYREAGELLQRLQLDLPLRTPVEQLTVAQQQMVEVSRALSMDARLIVMDEPTSALTGRETELLLARMRVLREQGVSIIFISHRMEELFAIANRVTVLRDGVVIGTELPEALDEDQIVQMMVGRDVKLLPEVRDISSISDEVLLQVQGLSRQPHLHSVDLTLRRGEIVGFAGLVGAGRSNLAETLFGITPAEAGTLTLAGERVTINSPQEAIALGWGFVPEDRKRQGLFLQMAITPNIVISELPRYSRASILNFRQMQEVAQDFVERLRIRTPNLQQTVANLSGGNQQKVVIARWLTLEPRLLILDEPTRGIDVGAKAEIHELIQQLANQGVTILMISSELPEVLGISDRIVVMREGRITGKLSREEATEDAVMRLAAGVRTATKETTI
ncbi:MAG: sugar ABC transporter ATP-binding protein [Chloroflexota bacterium]|nr:sugar ABC transporter ATP-binding protein [Chloroflexota bacterium]